MRIAYVVVILGALAAGCSKKSNQAASSAPAGSAAPAAATPAAAAPSGGAGACPACQKFDACCTALLADGSGDVEKSDCDGRAATCASLSAEMQPDMNSTCQDRVDDWHKAHPDVAACK